MEMLIARYMHPYNGRPYEREDAKSKLKVGRPYKVTRIDVGQWYTTVWLNGLGDGSSDGFNSVHFDFYAVESVEVLEELERPAALGTFEAEELGVRRSKGSEWPANEKPQPRVETSDLISRAEALERINEIFPIERDDDYRKGIAVGMAMAKVAIKDQTPAAERVGEWIETPNAYDIDGTHYYRCSACWSDVPTDEKLGHCPICGAKMED